MGKNTQLGLEISLLCCVADEPDSRVHGSIDDGVFHGHIYTAGASFSVERAARFWLNDSSTNTSQHSVIYSHDDIENNITGA